MGTQNFVDHTVTGKSSIIHFMEYNWLAGQPIGQAPSTPSPAPSRKMFNFTKIRANGVLFLKPSTGERVP
ncbi:MAG TPA: hypothetical protein VMU26_27680 [Candidatus Polarisedimenticolia bacterium]|nr:hypothetical protein [Candidatus Polarisedimenticolia bacterium]